MVVKQLLAKNANLLIRNNEDKRPLDLAIEDHDPSSRSIVEAIFKYVDANPNAYSLQSSDRVAIEEYFEDASRKAEERKKRRQATFRSRALKSKQGLVAAAGEEDAYTLSGYLLNNVEVDSIDEDTGLTLLHHAILSNHELPVWHLLAAGADPNVREKRHAPHGLTAYELAQKSDNPSIAALFQRCGNQLNPLDGSLMWQKKHYQVGRGIFSKRISGDELRRAYCSAAELSDRMQSCSVWSGPSMQVWYDYLGYNSYEDG